MAWQGSRKKCSGKRERCDREATWLYEFTSHVRPGVAGTPVATTRLERRQAPHPSPASQRHEIIVPAVFSLSGTELPALEVAATNFLCSCETPPRPPITTSSWLFSLT